MRPSRRVGGVALVFLVVSCAGPGALQQVPPAWNFIEQLSASGQTFTPMPAPAEVIAANVVLEQLEADGFPPFASPGARAGAPIFGVVTCRVEAQCLEYPGIAEPGRPVAIWLVVWPDVRGANDGMAQAYAAVDAATGQFIMGDGPPGP